MTSHPPRVHDLGFAQVDLERAERQGLAEVVYGEGKSPEQIAAIVATLMAHGQAVLVTRTNEAAYAAVKAVAPDAAFHAQARVIAFARTPPAHLGTAALAAAGTSDLPVLEECAVCLHAFGVVVDRVIDIGVSGLHRALSARDRLNAADVVIVFAGMEGALASVVGGLTHKPVIAVPTSVGYGASFQGLAALLSMLNACSCGITVTNIDNGFGAAVAARRMLTMAQARSVVG